MRFLKELALGTIEVAVLCVIALGAVSLMTGVIVLFGLALR